MMYIFSLVLLHVLVTGCWSAGGHDCHGPECINTAIDHVESSYDEHLCREIEKVDCGHMHHVHHAAHEHVCGTDGVTYSTHCTFAQARCFLILDHENNAHHHQLIVLDVQNYGPCITLTTSATTNAPAITSATLAAIGVQTTQQSVGQTTQQIGGQTTQLIGGQTTQQIGGQTTQLIGGQTTQQIGGQTNQQIGVQTTQQIGGQTTQIGIQTTLKQSKPTTIQQTTVAPTTTMPTTTATTRPQATTLSTLGLMQKVFCANKSTIDCSTNFDVQCGSDGRLYPNPCEMSKAACDNPTIQPVALTSCTIV